MSDKLIEFWAEFIETGVYRTDELHDAARATVKQIAEANAEIERLTQIVNDRAAKDYTIEAYKAEIERLSDDISGMVKDNTSLLEENEALRGYKRRVEAQAEGHTEYVLAQINQELEAEVKFEREKNQPLREFVTAYDDEKNTHEDIERARQALDKYFNEQASCL